MHTAPLSTYSRAPAFVHCLAVIPLSRAEAIIPWAVAITPKGQKERREGWHLGQEFYLLLHGALSMAIRLMIVHQQKFMSNVVLIKPSLESKSL